MTINITETDVQFFEFKLDRSAEVAASITSMARDYLDRIDREVAEAVRTGKRYQIPDIVIRSLATMNSNLRTDILLMNVSEIAQIMEYKLEGKM